ncbi:hypothetical protein N5E30_13160, partial [Pseudomonas chengduensis]
RANAVRAAHPTGGFAPSTGRKNRSPWAEALLGAFLTPWPGFCFSHAQSFSMSVFHVRLT